MTSPTFLLAAVALILTTTCRALPNTGETAIRRARLGEDGAPGFEELRASFRKGNAGYDLAWYPQAKRIPGRLGTRVVFVQSGPANGFVSAKGTPASEVDLGDIVLLRAGEELMLDAALDALVFDVPEELPRALPSFVRPDWDPNITDTPGGCAEETGAYRRILLTWLSKVGPYNFRALNAHRVRIEDSFTHYHPVDGGFDELYLVQMTRPGARVLTSDHTQRIEDPEGCSKEQAKALFEAWDLEVGDLVYMPRGTVHRGLGGALVQVITTPGFRPGAEIGVDHHLRAIAERLDVNVPYHESASLEAVRK